jgi:hypothetical protein
LKLQGTQKLRLKPKHEKVRQALGGKTLTVTQILQGPMFTHACGTTIAPLAGASRTPGIRYAAPVSWMAASAVNPGILMDVLLCCKSFPGLGLSSGADVCSAPTVFALRFVVEVFTFAFLPFVAIALAPSLGHR